MTVTLSQLEAADEAEPAMTAKILGKISSANFGYGGYDGAMFGFAVSFELSGSSACSDFYGTWAERSSSAEYTVEEHEKYLVDAVFKLRDTLSDAKKQHVDQLAGTPVECTFENMKLVSWRVLTEVL